MRYENEKTKCISFPLGGLGTGCIGLAGNGELIDWEILNRPNKNTRNGYSHFAIKAEYKGKTFAKVLQGDTNESYIGAHREGVHVGYGFGPSCESLAGFPHFKRVTFDALFPVAELTFSDEDFPAVTRLCAFNPLIPNDESASGLPAAFFEWEIENTTEETIKYTVAFSVRNVAEKSVNAAIAAAGKTGVFFRHAEKGEDEIGYSDLTVVTDATEAVAQAYWYRGGWKDPVTTFWNNFTLEGRLKAREYAEAGAYDHGTVTASVTVPAGEKRKLRFVLAWNAPVQYNYWAPYKDAAGRDVTWKNYYATQFENSLATADYALREFSALWERTRTFTTALRESTLPAAVLDAVSANLSVLKSPTVMRLEDGSFWAWEGVQETTGSCEGNCQHVWNYAYALPFLFPRLERSMRELTHKYALKESGETAFRVPLPLGRECARFHPCVDGQMGEVIKCWREWRLSGDTEWLKRNASSVFKMLEFAWDKESAYGWDRDKDGVLEGRQHHTLDVELFGPNPWLQGFYLLALDCAAQIASVLGESAREKEYRRLYDRGRAWMNENLFNGEYFTQKLDLRDLSVLDRYDGGYYRNDETGEIKYQIGEGCEIDQMLADWHAAILGLERVFDAEKKKKALESLYKYNFKRSMREVTNAWRNFALNDESGVIICAYPEGVEKPLIPIPYCEETMTGFEYALAGLMIAQGMVEEGESIVAAVRARYDGSKRNPWSELECGSNYARSTASFALLPIYSGLSFDMTERRIGFSPLEKEGSWLWSVGGSWGSVRFTKKKRVLSVLGEKFPLAVFGLPYGEKAASVLVDGNPVKFKQEGGRVAFNAPPIEKTLEITLA